MMNVAVLKWEDIAFSVKEKLIEKGIGVYSEFFTPEKDIKPKSKGRKRTVTTSQQKRAKIKRKNKTGK